MRDGRVWPNLFPLPIISHNQSLKSILYAIILKINFFSWLWLLVVPDKII